MKDWKGEKMRVMKKIVASIWCMITFILYSGTEQEFPNIPKLLIKIPTRSRPEKFFKTLDLFYQKLSHNIPFQFLIACDIDDATMHNDEIIGKLKSYPHLQYFFGQHASKIEAYNAGITEYDFDIVLCGSDDMEPMLQDYDMVIVEKMKEYFPDGDGVLHFYDGNASQICNTFPIMGKKYFQRFGYIYHPDYRSFFCQLELAAVAKMIKREKCFKQVLFKHNHPAWGLGSWDSLYARNDISRSVDRLAYDRRRHKLFHLNESIIKNKLTKKWSILILTLDEREDVFQRLYEKINKQIKDAGLEKEIEVLVCKDNRENPIGFKRNVLLEQSSGEYTNFLDDDDDVHENYISMIYEKLNAKPDCVRHVAIMTTQGQNPQLGISSIENGGSIKLEKGVYRVPVGHLNTIKRSIACQFLFKEVNFGEDRAWAKELYDSGLIKKEAFLDEPYYFYLYDGKYH